MTRFQFHFLLWSSVACLILSLALFLQGRSLERWQNAYRLQQNSISASAQTQQTLQNLLNDLAQLSSNNERVKELLTKRGYKLNQAPGVAPGASPPESAAPVLQLAPSTPK